MKKTLFPIFIFIVSVFTVCAQEAVEVKKVDFNKTDDDWIQMEIELACGDNRLPDARDSRFVEEIKVKAYLAYKTKHSQGFDYYTSEVEIVIMEKGEDYNVYFYLPGLIVERDQIQPQEPEYYYVEVSVKGSLQAPRKGSKAFSPNIPNLEALTTFTSQAGEKNQHLLMPVYFVPAEYLGRVSDMPTFLRRDVRK